MKGREDPGSGYRKVSLEELKGGKARGDMI